MQRRIIGATVFALAASLSSAMFAIAELGSVP